MKGRTMTSQEYDAYRRGFSDGASACLFDEGRHPPPRIAPPSYVTGWYDGFEQATDARMLIEIVREHP